MSNQNPEQFPAQADVHIADLTTAPSHERQFISDLFENSIVSDPIEAATRREDFVQYAGELAAEFRVQQQAQFYVDQATSWNGFVKSETAVTSPLEAPVGFSAASLIKNGSLIRADSLEKSIIALSHDAINQGHVEVDTLELITDAGHAIRYSDLRDKMSSSVRKGGPETTQQTARLDKAFFNDVRLFAERGHASNRVASAPGVFYTKVPDSKLRTYWMVPQDERADGVRTIVRVADCADSLAKEVALYRQLFGVTMR